MSREEVFEIRKEITLMKDFEESISSEMAGSINIDELDKVYKEKYNNLDEEEQKWVNEKFLYWIDIYMLRQSQTGGCASCSGGGCCN